MEKKIFSRNKIKLVLAGIICIFFVSLAFSGTMAFSVTSEKPPILQYNPTSYYFGNLNAGETASTTFEIWNSGGQTLSFLLTGYASWVTVIPSGGASKGEHVIITVNIDSSGMSPGYYNTRVRIFSDGGSGNFSVSGYILPPETNYLNIPASAFTHGESTENYSNYGNRIESRGGGAHIVCPVYLPYGATVINFTIYYYDNNPDISGLGLMVYLCKKPIIYVYEEIPYMATCNIGTYNVCSNSIIEYTDNSINDALIDSENNQYYIKATLFTDSQTQMGFCGCRIAYTL